MQHKKVTLTFHGATWISAELAFELIQVLGKIMNYSDQVIAMQTGEEKAAYLEFSLVNIEKAFGHSKRVHKTYEISFFSKAKGIDGALTSCRIKKECLNSENIFSNVHFNFLAITFHLNQYTDHCLNEIFKFIADKIDAVWGRAYVNLALYPRKILSYPINYGLPSIYWKNYFGTLLCNEVDWEKLGDEFEIIKTKKGIVANYMNSEESLAQHVLEFEKKVSRHYFCELNSSDGPIQEWFVPFLIKSAWKSFTEKRKVPLFNFDYSKMTF